MNSWLPKLATGLAIAGIAAALVAWGQQKEMGKDVESNKSATETALEKAEKNQNDITVIATEWRIFQIQYAVDQSRAADERKAILEAVNR